MIEKGESKGLLVSFIITDYNIPLELLKECIDSVLAVGLLPQEREVILVDDGSDASPWERLEEYHKDIKYIRQENQGLSAARNLGLEQASGKFIQFVDGDDCLIVKNYNIIAGKLKNPDSFLQDTDIIMFKSSGTPCPRVSAARLLKLFLYTSGRDFLKKNSLKAAAWGYVFRRGLLGDLRFTPGILHEDEEFTPLLLLRTGNVLFTSIRAYYYRRREDSIVHNTSQEHIDKRMGDLFGVIMRLRGLSATREGEALKRRTRQLSMDYIYNAMTMAGSYEKYLEYEEPLLKYRILPLPLGTYTVKYLLFSLMTRLRPGRRMMYKILSRK